MIEGVDVDLEVFEMNNNCIDSEFFQKGFYCFVNSFKTHKDCLPVLGECQSQIEYLEGFYCAFNEGGWTGISDFKKCLNSALNNSLLFNEMILLINKCSFDLNN